MKVSASVASIDVVLLPTLFLAVQDFLLPDRY